MGFFNWITGQMHLFVLSIVMFVQAFLGAFTPQPIVVTPPPLALSTQSTTVASSTATKNIPKTATVITSTKKITKIIVPPPPATSTTPPIPKPPVALIPTEQLNVQVRASLVNILCTTKAGGSFAPISGSGVIIDTRGVILTNAHVGQFFLLRDYGTPGNIQCVVRTGSPATPTYNADLLYLPPAWVDANASQINSQQAMGTGENDYAFLRIIGPFSSSIAYPSSFAALPMSASNPDIGDPVLLAGYPAGLLGGITIQKDLYASSAQSIVQELFTFKDPSTVDLIALSGTVVAQSGSSGGAEVSAQSGKLVGLIATESQGTTTSSRILNAITISHVNRSLTALGKGGIVSLLTGDLAQIAADFNTTIAPGEIKTLEDVLNKASR